MYHGQGHQQLSLSYSEIYSIEELDHPNPKMIKKLSIVHCHLQSLAGIQRFTELVSINLKFNNLEVAQDILLISNKSNIRQLNLQGNAIQYYALCTYASLIKNGFDNLLILNNKDYSKWGKSRKKVPNMLKLNSQLNSIEKSMTRTLKKTIRGNVKQKYKFITESIEPQQQQETSRNSQKLRTVSQQQRSPLKQISLSNANMIRSMKVDNQYSPLERLKGPQLVIHPVEFNQGQMSHIPATQPTATFASQKQKQNTGVNFWKINKMEKSCISAVEEDPQLFNYNTEQQQISGISECYSNMERQSFSRTRPFNNRSNLEQIHQHNLQIENMAIGFYTRKLKQKVLKVLRQASLGRKRSLDMPCQRKYI